MQECVNTKWIFIDHICITNNKKHKGIHRCVNFLAFFHLHFH